MNSFDIIKELFTCLVLVALINSVAKHLIQADKKTRLNTSSTGTTFSQRGNEEIQQVHKINICNADKASLSQQNFDFMKYQLTIPALSREINTNMISGATNMNSGKYGDRKNNYFEYYHVSSIFFNQQYKTYGFSTIKNSDHIYMFNASQEVRFNRLQICFR
jgi:hypothetical protein